MRAALVLVVLTLVSAGCACGSHCDPSTCTGCCDATQTCVSGNAPAACGSTGRACVTCGAGQGCADGTCKACGPANCSGCCDPSAGCVTGDAKTACGTAGAACGVCSATQLCSATHACVADPDVCTPGAATVTTATVQAAVLGPRCASCHTTGGSGDGYGDFTSAAKAQLVVSKKSLYAGTGNLKIVDPTVLANSTLWLKVSAPGATGRPGPHNEATSAAEPQDASGKLGAAAQQQLKDWICTGATP